MRFVLYTIIFGVLLVAACRSNDTGSQTNQNTAVANSSTPRVTATPVHSKIDACTLLTSDDLKGVQGETYKEAQRSDRVDGDFIVAQCYFAMPTLADSVVLNVTTQDGSGARTPKAFWEQTFGGDEEKEREGKSDREKGKQKDKDKDKEKAKNQPAERGEEGEEKEAAPPERVKGLGDEAFWVASPVGGAIYVLKNDVFFRISVGGSGDQKTKLNKSKLLAQKVLTKL
jgi:hypothetical protein